MLTDLSGAPMVQEECPRPGGTALECPLCMATRELALMSKLRLMGLGLAIWPSHMDVAPAPWARAWQNWLIWCTMVLRSAWRPWCKVPAIERGMVEVETVTLGGASASVSFLVPPWRPGGGCWRCCCCCFCCCSKRAGGGCGPG